MRKERLNKNFLKKYSKYNFNQIKEEKIYLVGSARFKKYFIEIESILQVIHGKLVGICSVDGLLNKKKFSFEEWEKLQEIALRKIKDYDAILVLNVDGYIGDHSNEEIEFFKQNFNKPIYYLSKLLS